MLTFAFIIVMCCLFQVLVMMTDFVNGRRYPDSLATNSFAVMSMGTILAVSFVAALVVLAMRISN